MSADAFRRRPRRAGPGGHDMTAIREEFGG